MAVFDAVYYGALIYSRVRDLRVYLFLDYLPEGEFGRLFYLSPTLPAVPKMI